MALERVEAISLLVECSTPCSLKSHAQMKVVAPQVGGAWARVGTRALRQLALYATRVGLLMPVCPVGLWPDPDHFHNFLADSGWPGNGSFERRSDDALPTFAGVVQW